MLLIFGTRVSQTVIAVVSLVCVYCHVRTPQNVIKLTNRFTLFFVPLFPVSSRYVNRCTNCGAETWLTADQARSSVAWAAARQ